MGRKNRRNTPARRPLPLDGSSFVPTSVVEVRGVEYKVRPMGSSHAT